jgi:hypothetical protein
LLPVLIALIPPASPDRAVMNPLAESMVKSFRAVKAVPTVITPGSLGLVPLIAWSVTQPLPSQECPCEALRATWVNAGDLGISWHGQVS